MTKYVYAKSYNRNDSLLFDAKHWVIEWRTFVYWFNNPVFRIRMENNFLGTDLFISMIDKHKQSNKFKGHLYHTTWTNCENLRSPFPMRVSGQRLHNAHEGKQKLYCLLFKTLSNILFEYRILLLCSPVPIVSRESNFSRLLSLKWSPLNLTSM